MLNKIFLETDGLVVGGTQLTTTGGNVNIANSIYVGANTVTGNLTVTGNFTYPAATSKVPVFRAVGSLTTYQPPNNGTEVAIAFDRVEFDSNKFYNPTNQWQYINGIYCPPWSYAPNIPGYYQVSATIGFQSVGATYLEILKIYKQNLAIAAHQTLNNSTNVFATVSTLIYMDGVSDYLSVYGNQLSGNQVGIGAIQPYHSFTACLVRPA